MRARTRPGATGHTAVRSRDQLRFIRITSTTEVRRLARSPSRVRAPQNYGGRAVHSPTGNDQRPSTGS